MPRKIDEKRYDKKSKKNNIIGNISGVFAIISLLSSMFFYVYHWVYIYNVPSWNVSGWGTIILNGIAQVVFLSIVIFVMVNKRDLMLKKSVKIVWVCILLNSIWYIYCLIARIIDLYLKELGDDNNTVFGVEEAIQAQCLRLINYLIIVVSCVLVPCIVKKRSLIFVRILSICWLVYIANILISLYWGNTGYRLKYIDYEQYLSSMHTKLYNLFIFLFGIWFFINVAQRFKQIDHDGLNKRDE